MIDLASPAVLRHDILSGEIDLSDAAELEGAITDAVPNTVRGVVLDLSGLTYIDSSGIRLLLSLAGKLRWRGQDLVLAPPPDSRCRRVLSMAGVGSTVLLEPSVDVARARLHAPGPPG